MSETLYYGDGDDQFATTNHPPNRAPRAAVVLVHGGYWREHFTSALMSPVEEMFLAAGWMTINIEYRRGPHHFWPIPSDDVGNALAMSAKVTDDAGIGGRLVSVGHSVGGQLVLLNHRAVDAVVALAPVTDAARVHAEGLGDNAAHEYFQTSPSEDCNIFRSASPIFTSPPAVPTLVVHGMLDDRVPPQHTESYLQSVDQLSRIEVHRSAGSGHVDLIDPDAEHWASTVEWMSSAFC